MNHSPGEYTQVTKKDWLTTKPIFKEKELLIKSFQVMQRWEDNYMKSLVAIATFNTGISKIEHNELGWYILAWNDHAHLGEVR